MEQTKRDFSEGEINDFINMGRKLAGKAVLHALAEVLKESDECCKKLAKKVIKLVPYSYAGFVQCTFDETPLKLNICLSLVERDYRTDVSIPHENYSADLYSKYDFLRKTAIAYWAQFCEENRELVAQISRHRDDVNFSTLTVDPANPTTLYFDPACKKRIGIFCYYTDEAGVPYYKTN